MKNRLGYIVLLLALAQVLLILFSWLVTAANPDLALRSLLSSEGVRWFVGSFVDNQQTPLLVWFITVSLAAGCLVRSGLYGSLLALLHLGKMHSDIHYRQKIGLRIAFFELFAYVVVMLLLTVVPHAILLSVTGQLFPSSFSASIVPSLSFIVLVMSLSYGIASGAIDSIGKMHDMLVYGLRVAANLLPSYVLAVQLYMSLRFVFLLV